MPHEVEIPGIDGIAQATLRPVKVAEGMVPVEGCTHRWRKKVSADGSAPTCEELPRESVTKLDPELYRVLPVQSWFKSGIPEHTRLRSI